MACFSPVVAWQPLEGGALLFREKRNCRELKIPCGQCIGCRLERSRQWAVRIMHEASSFHSNAFVTLTYDDSNAPLDGALSYRPFQLFMKRLRKELGSVRFYMCGEYGELSLRPHFHACLFNVDFVDRSPCSADLFRSPLLERLWPFGFSSIGELTFESAAYVARYVCKKVTGGRADEHYSRVVESTGEVVQVPPEFARMSLRPGIGATWIDKFRSDVYPRDAVVVRGHLAKPPRYYDKRLEAVLPFVMDDVRFQRVLSVTPEMIADGSPERLAVRQACVKASLKKRSL